LAATDNFKRKTKKPKKKKKESGLLGGDAKKPKGNGINDSLCVASCLCRSLLVFYSALPCCKPPTFAFFFIFLCAALTRSVYSLLE
jgi:hypothetical protein